MAAGPSPAHSAFIPHTHCLLLCWGLPGAGRLTCWGRGWQSRRVSWRQSPERVTEQKGRWGQGPLLHGKPEAPPQGPLWQGSVERGLQRGALGRPGGECLRSGGSRCRGPGVQAWLACAWTSEEVARMPGLGRRRWWEGRVLGPSAPGGPGLRPPLPGAPAGVWAEEWQGPPRAFRVRVESLPDWAGRGESGGPGWLHWSGGVPSWPRALARGPWEPSAGSSRESRSLAITFPGGLLAWVLFWAGKGGAGGPGLSAAPSSGGRCLLGADSCGPAIQGPCRPGGRSLKERRARRPGGCTCPCHGPSGLGRLPKTSWAPRLRGDCGGGSRMFRTGPARSVPAEPAQRSGPRGPSRGSHCRAWSL